MASFIQQNYFEIHPCCVLIAEQHSIVWVYHSLFIHSPLDDYLGCFQCVETKLILLQVKLLLMFMYQSLYGRTLFLGKYLRRMIGSYDRCIFNFLKRLPNYFAKCLYRLTFPPATCESSSCFEASPTLGLIGSF